MASRRRERQAPSGEQVAFKKFQTVINMIHSQISQHRNGTIFHNPIKRSEAPDYHEIVKRPIDLKTIKARVRDGVISNSAEFQRDVFLMFANAMMYNRPGSDIYNMAEDVRLLFSAAVILIKLAMQMMLESESQIQTYRTTEVTHRG
jgi:bromodomain-containing protein 8